MRTDFETVPLVQFVQRLRNYTHHRRLPVATGTLSGGLPDMTFETSFVLHSTDLLKWSGWGASAKSYISTAEEIQIADVMRTYAAIVVDFHEWFLDALRARHHGELVELEQAEERRRQAWGRPFPGPE